MRTVTQWGCQQIFFKIWEKSGALYQVGEILTSNSKAVKSREILFLTCHQVCKRVSSLIGTILVMTFKQFVQKALISVASLLALLPKVLSWMVIEKAKLFLLIQMSGSPA